jgi:energy-coupling factor transport system permease protein
MGGFGRTPAMNAHSWQQAHGPLRLDRIDARAKLAVFAAGTGVALLWDDPRLNAALLVAVLAACLAAGVSGAYLRLMLRAMIPLALLLLVTHGWFDTRYVLRLTGHAALTPLWVAPHAWPWVGGAILSREGLLYGCNVAAKSVTLLLLIPLCVFTTAPDNLIVGLVKLRLPYRVTFVLASTLRFFPLLFAEIQGVRDAQRLRGLIFEDLGPFERIRAHARVAVPAILGAMFRAQQMEVVLQSKAFSGSSDRTYLHDSTLRPADWLVITGAGLALAAAVTLYVTAGAGRFTG